MIAKDNNMSGERAQYSKGRGRYTFGSVDLSNSFTRQAPSTGLAW